MSLTRKSIISFLLLLLLLVPAVVPVAAAPPAQNQGDWAIPGGRFFTQTANAGGFSVVDNGEARFWSEFQRLGGLQTVGYPISRRFVYDGFVTQAFQKLVLQWRPEVGQAWPVNVFDELSKKGFDETLLISRQTPRPFPPGGFDDPGATWAQIVAARQALLSANPAIRARYFSMRDPLNVFGLPTSRVEDMGNHYAIRTQRAVFQQWKEAVPWAARGQVTIANGGDIAKELGWLPGEALVAEATPGQDIAELWEIHTLLVGPGTPGTLYAYQYISGRSSRLMVSNDFGATWQPFAGGLPVEPGCLNTLSMDYATANELYAATCQGLYRWTGSQWERRTQSPIYAVAIVYGNAQKLWASVPMNNLTRVVYSENGGQSWNDGGTGSASLTRLALDPKHPEMVYHLWAYKGWWFGLSRSSGNGQWSALPMPLEQSPIINGMTIAGATGDIYVSARSHTEAEPGSTSFGVHQLWRTSNASALDIAEVRWELVHNFGVDTDARVLASGWSPNGLALYVSFKSDPTAAGVLYRSLDGGYHWEVVPLPNN